MKKILFTWLLISVLFLSGCSQPTATNNPAGNQRGQKFSDTPYYNNAYLISGDTLSADAQKALTGFQMDKKTMPDGTTQINLKALDPSYHDQQYTLKSGEQLYFIEKLWADDQSGSETNINDETAVIVDSQGNIVQ
jgi:PBP1b-binding outer membrane lipoprotein LpoB